MASTKRSKTSRRKQVKFQVPYTIYYLFSLLLIILGSAFIFWGSSRFFRLESNTQKKVDASQNKFIDKPTKLYIPKLNEVLYVSEGEAYGDRWTISETGVSYLSSSALPGSNGNAVIYGHNKDDIFGYLYLVSPSDPIYVVMASGKVEKYFVSEEKEIGATQVEILDATNDGRLTIYTCSGFLDQARFVVVAHLATSSI